MPTIARKTYTPIEKSKVENIFEVLFEFESYDPDGWEYVIVHQNFVRDGYESAGGNYQAADDSRSGLAYAIEVYHDREFEGYL